MVDLRRSIRANMMKGEIIELRRRERRRKKIRLVLLADVSGSMDLYSRFLLLFLYALQNAFGRVETFTFATRLTRITEHLKGASYKQALRQLARRARLVRGHADRRVASRLQPDVGASGRSTHHRGRALRRLGHRRAGRASPTEMLTLKRKAGRVIWLNPLLGNPSYEPLTRGMAAALPLVDHFAAAHNLASLRDLASHLRLG